MTTSYPYYIVGELEYDNNRIRIALKPDADHCISNIGLCGDSRCNDEMEPMCVEDAECLTETDYRLKMTRGEFVECTFRRYPLSDATTVSARISERIGDRFVIEIAGDSTQYLCRLGRGYLEFIADRELAIDPVDSPIKTFATIRENDEMDGAIIELGYTPYTDESGTRGYRLTASNGDGIRQTWRAQTPEQCEADIVAVWGRWATYKEV